MWKKTPNASWIYNQKSSRYALKCLWPVIWFRCLCILLTGKDAFQNAKYVTGDARIPRKSLNSNWNQILPLTLSDINLFLPVSAGRDVTAIFNISFSRNKTVGVIYFSANLWMDAPRKLCLCIPLPIFKLCCSVLHDTAELSKPQKVINHQNKNALTWISIQYILANIMSMDVSLLFGIS